jgi:hypothetical protein
MQWTFRHVDATDFIAVGGVVEDLAVGDVDATGNVGCNTFAAAFREGFEIFERAFRADGRGTRACLGRVAHMEPRSRGRIEAWIHRYDCWRQITRLDIGRQQNRCSHLFERMVVLGQGCDEDLRIADGGALW